MSIIADLIKGLLGSKKFTVMVGGLIIILLAKLKLNVDPDTVNKAVAALIAWLLAQGIADHNKEAAKINAGK